MKILDYAGSMEVRLYNLYEFLLFFVLQEIEIHHQTQVSVLMPCSIQTYHYLLFYTGASNPEKDRESILSEETVKATSRNSILKHPFCT